MSNPFKAAIKAIKMEMDTDTFYNERDALWAVIHFLEAVENAKVVFYPDGQRGFEAVKKKAKS